MHRTGQSCRRPAPGAGSMRSNGTCVEVVLRSPNWCGPPHEPRPMDALTDRQHGPDDRDAETGKSPRGVPVSMRLTATLAAAVIRIIGGSLRFSFVLDDPDTAPQRMKTPAVYTFWHEMLLLLTYTHVTEVTPLISRSGDGTIIAETVRSLGGRAIRGSTDHSGGSRGGRTALRQMLRHGRHHHIGVPVDGPVGPRRTARSPGVAWVGSRGRMPVIPVGVEVNTLVSLGPGDMVINVPVPFSRVWFVVGKPIDVPPHMRNPDVRAFMQKLQTAMDDVQSRAESYAHNTSRPPVRPLTLTGLRAL